MALTVGAGYFPTCPGRARGALGRQPPQHHAPSRTRWPARPAGAHPHRPSTRAQAPREVLEPSPAGPARHDGALALHAAAPAGGGPGGSQVAAERPSGSEVLPGAGGGVEWPGAVGRSPPSRRSSSPGRRGPCGLRPHRHLGRAGRRAHWRAASRPSAPSRPSRAARRRGRAGGVGLFERAAGLPTSRCCRSSTHADGAAGPAFAEKEPSATSLHALRGLQPPGQAKIYPRAIPLGQASTAARAALLRLQRPVTWAGSAGMARGLSKSSCWSGGPLPHRHPASCRTTCCRGAPRRVGGGGVRPRVSAPAWSRSTEAWRTGARLRAGAGLRAWASTSLATSRRPSAGRPQGPVAARPAHQPRPPLAARALPDDHREDRAEDASARARRDRPAARVGFPPNASPAPRFPLWWSAGRAAATTSNAVPQHPSIATNSPEPFSSCTPRRPRGEGSRGQRVSIVSPFGRSELRGGGCGVTDRVLPQAAVLPRAGPAKRRTCSPTRRARSHLRLPGDALRRLPGRAPGGDVSRVRMRDRRRDLLF
jgi:hypothetical protein